MWLGAPRKITFLRQDRGQFSVYQHMPSLIIAQADVDAFESFYAAARIEYILPDLAHMTFDSL